MLMSRCAACALDDIASQVGYDIPFRPSVPVAILVRLPVFLFTFTGFDSSAIGVAKMKEDETSVGSDSLMVERSRLFVD